MPIGIESRISWTADIPQLKDQQTNQVLSADRLEGLLGIQYARSATSSRLDELRRVAAVHLDAARWAA